MTIPYPCLVSRILELHKIWYLLDLKPLKPLQFSDKHLHRMNIEVRVGPEQRPPEGKKRRRTTSRPSRAPQDEAQSSAPQQPTTAPSFAQASLQHFMQTEFRKMGEEFTQAFHSETQTYVNNLLKAAAEYFTGRILDLAVGSLKTSVDSLQQTMETRLSALEGRVSSIEDFIRGTQAPPHAPTEPSSPVAAIDLVLLIEFPLPKPAVPAPESSSPTPQSPPPAPPVSESLPAPEPSPSASSSPPHPL